MAFPTEYVACEYCDGTGQAEPACGGCGGKGVVSFCTGIWVTCSECDNEHCRDCGGCGVQEEEQF